MAAKASLAAAEDPNRQREQNDIKRTSRFGIIPFFLPYASFCSPDFEGRKIFLGGTRMGLGWNSSPYTDSLVPGLVFGETFL